MSSNERINILVSFAHIRGNSIHRNRACQNYLFENRHKFNIILDSGAYTNFTLKGKKGWKPIEVSEYIDFLKSNSNMFDEYIMLDVIADPARTAKNLEAMVGAGLAPIPVLTETEHPDRAKELQDISSGRICLGGPARLGKAWGMARCLQVAKHCPEAKIHALGFSPAPALYSVPITSCDSSSWTWGQRYGYFFSDRAFNQNKRKAIKDPAMLRHIAACGFTKNDILLNAQAITTRSYSVQYVLAMGAALHIQDKCNEAGIRFYIVVINEEQIRMTLTTRKHYLGKAVIDGRAIIKEMRGLA